MKHCKIVCKNVTLQKCSSIHRYAAWSIYDRKRAFLWVFIMLHAILWHRVVWFGICVNPALVSTILLLPLNSIFGYIAHNIAYFGAMH